MLVVFQELFELIGFLVGQPTQNFRHRLVAELRQHVGGVVRGQLVDNFRQGTGVELLDDLTANPFVEKNDNLCSRVRRQREHDARAIFISQQLERLGDVGGSDIGQLRRKSRVVHRGQRRQEPIMKVVFF